MIRGIQFKVNSFAVLGLGLEQVPSLIAPLVGFKGKGGSSNFNLTKENNMASQNLMNIFENEQGKITIQYGDTVEFDNDMDLNVSVDQLVINVEDVEALVLLLKHVEENYEGLPND